MRHLSQFGHWGVRPSPHKTWASTILVGSDDFELPGNAVSGGTDRLYLAHLSRLGIQLRHFFDIGAVERSLVKPGQRGLSKCYFRLVEPLVEHAPALHAEG